MPTTPWGTTNNWWNPPAPRPRGMSVMNGPDGPGEYDESGNFTSITPSGGSGGGGNRGGGSGGGGNRSGGRSSSSSANSAYEKQRKMMEKTRKNIEKAFKGLLSSLGPTYARYRTDYSAAADKTLAQRKQELLAQQIAYGTADSEQRQQAEERLASEIFGERDNYYKSLAEKEASQRAEIAYKQALAMSGLDENMANSYIDEWKASESIRQQELDRAMKSIGSGGSQNKAITTWLDNAMRNYVKGKGGVQGALGTGGREYIANQAVGLFGGNPEDYTSRMPDYWEEMYPYDPNNDPWDDQ